MESHNERPLDAEQAAGFSDMDPASFRAAGDAVVDLMADYLAGVEQFPVFPPIEPGSLAPQFPVHAPDGPEPLSRTRLDDRFAIRLSVGNLRTEPRHVVRAWELLRQAAAATDGLARS